MGTAAPGCPAEQSSAAVKLRRTPTSFNPGELFSALLKQLYHRPALCSAKYLFPVDFEDRDTLEEVLSEQLASDSSRPARVISCSAAGRKTFSSRPCRQQCQAVL